MPPSDDDVRHIRRFFDSFGERFREMKAGNFDLFDEYYAPDAVLESPEAFPTPGVVRGRDEYRAWFDEAYGPWEGVVWELERLDVVGESIVTGALIRGRPVGEPVDLEVRVAIVYELRDGRISRSRLYLDHGRALAAARDDAAA